MFLVHQCYGVIFLIVMLFFNTTRPAGMCGAGDATVRFTRSVSSRLYAKTVLAGNIFEALAGAEDESLRLKYQYSALRTTFYRQALDHFGSRMPDDAELLLFLKRINHEEVVVTDDYSAARRVYDGNLMQEVARIELRKGRSSDLNMFEKELLSAAETYNKDTRFTSLLWSSPFVNTDVKEFLHSIFDRLKRLSGFIRLPLYRYFIALPKDSIHKPIPRCVVELVCTDMVDKYLAQALKDVIYATFDNLDEFDTNIVFSQARVIILYYLLTLAYEIYGDDNISTHRLFTDLISYVKEKLFADDADSLGAALQKDVPSFYPKFELILKRGSANTVINDFFKAHFPSGPVTAFVID